MHFKCAIPCRAADYLGFGQTALSHLFVPSKVEQTLLQSEGGSGEQVKEYAREGGGRHAFAHPKIRFGLFIRAIRWSTGDCK